jgi:hypothetical protein
VGTIVAKSTIAKKLRERDREGGQKREEKSRETDERETRI